MQSELLGDITRVLEDIKGGCDGCPLKNSTPLIFKPHRHVDIMVVTEGPTHPS